MMTLATITLLLTAPWPAPTAHQQDPREDKTAEIELQGDARFKEQVGKALALLKTKAPDAFKTVKQHIGVIKQSKRSGMRAWTTPPTFDLADRTAFYSVSWCAGAIAHDSIHSQLYHNYKAEHASRVPDRVWTGQAAERNCIAHQLAVLKQIGAPELEVKYCAGLDGTHHDTNKDGVYDQKDYRRRDW